MILIFYLSLFKEKEFYNFMQDNEIFMLFYYSLASDQLTNIISIPYYLSQESIPPIHIARYGDSYFSTGYRGKMFGFLYTLQGKFISEIDTPYIYFKNRFDSFIKQMGYKNLDIFLTFHFAVEKKIWNVEGNYIVSKLKPGIGSGFHYYSDGGELSLYSSYFYSLLDSIEKHNVELHGELKEHLSFYFITPIYYTFSLGIYYKEKELLPYIEIANFNGERNGPIIDVMLSLNRWHVELGYRMFRNFEICISQGSIYEKKNIPYQEIQIFYKFSGIGIPPYFIFSKEGK